MIPVHRPLFAGNEETYLRECVASGWVSSEGSFVGKFETALADYCQRNHAAAVANGTAALALAMEALDLGPGDEVIMPALTIISCASAILRTGATPVLVDVDPRTFNMRPEEIRKKIGPRTRAILVVHLYGLPCEVDEILALSRLHGLKIIEDAAEMLGQTYRGKPCGSFGDISVLSFYANKIVTTGEGGMVLTNDPGLHARVRSLRNLAFGERRFVHEELGWNYRMSNLQAALGLAQFERITELLSKKTELAALYREELSELRELVLPLERTEYAQNIHWVFPVLLKSGAAEELARRLLEHGVASRPFFFPMHMQPALLKLGLFKGESYPVSEAVSSSGLYLPLGAGVTRDEVHQVCRTLRTLLS